MPGSTNDEKRKCIFLHVERLAKIYLHLQHSPCRLFVFDFVLVSFDGQTSTYLCRTLEGEMIVRDYLKQPYGILHGGASVALAETLGSLASNLCIEEGVSTVGLDINANHIRAVREGLLKGSSIPIHIGKSTHVWEIKMYNNEKITCISRLTMAILKR